MNYKAFTRVLFISAIASLFTAGCASIPNQPFTAYTGQEKIQAALEALGKRVVMAYDDAA